MTACADCLPPLPLGHFLSLAFHLCDPGASPARSSNPRRMAEMQDSRSRSRMALEQRFLSTEMHLRDVGTSLLRSSRSSRHASAATTPVKQRGRPRDAPWERRHSGSGDDTDIEDGAEGRVQSEKRGEAKRGQQREREGMGARGREREKGVDEKRRGNGRVSTGDASPRRSPAVALPRGSPHRSMSAAGSYAVMARAAAAVLSKGQDAGRSDGGGAKRGVGGGGPSGGYAARARVRVTRVGEAVKASGEGARGGGSPDVMRGRARKEAGGRRPQVKGRRGDSDEGPKPLVPLPGLARWHCACARCLGVATRESLSSRGAVSLVTRAHLRLIHSVRHSCSQWSGVLSPRTKSGAKAAKKAEAKTSALVSESQHGEPTRPPSLARRGTRDAPEAPPAQRLNSATRSRQPVDRPRRHDTGGDASPSGDRVVALREASTGRERSMSGRRRGTAGAAPRDDDQGAPLSSHKLAALTDSEVSAVGGGGWPGVRCARRAPLILPLLTRPRYR